MRQLVRIVPERLPIRCPVPEPLQVVSLATVSVRGRELDVIEAEIRRADFVFLTLVEVRVLLRKFFCEPLPGLFDRAWRKTVWVWQMPRRIVREGLQMALANQRGIVTGRSENVRKGVSRGRKGASVVAKPVQRRHPARHDRGAVRHADRGGHMKVREPRAA